MEPALELFDGDASAAASMQFENGVCASYVGSWCSQALETSWNANWRFECEKGVLLVEDDCVYIQRLLSVNDGARGLANVHDEKRSVPLVGMEREGQDYLLHEFYQARHKGQGSRYAGLRQYPHDGVGFRRGAGL